MPYATQAQIESAAGGATRFLQLADWNLDGAVDASVVAEAQARADGWIDEYLRHREATPIENPTDTLIRLAADEAVYWLRKVRGMLTVEEIDQRKERERQLSEMRSGTLRYKNDPRPNAKSAAFVENEADVSREGTKGMW